VRNRSLALASLSLVVSTALVATVTANASALGTATKAQVGVSAAVPASAPAPPARKAGPAPEPYQVKQGLTLINPLNATRDDIAVQIMRAVNHSFKGSRIRIATWNFDSWRFVGALTAAHKRGVSVRLILSRQLFIAQGPRGPAGSLARNLAGFGNAKRPANMRSKVLTCDHSCRGRGGAMHSKFYVFSKSGKSKRVVMNSSANLTAASRNVQWNDLYTVVDSRIAYRAYMDVFKEMELDKPSAYADFTDGKIYGFFYPGLSQPDIVMTMLNQVTCAGAKGAGINGKTAIRVGQDVFNNKRGVIIARKLLALHRAGCNVRVVYSQAVGESKGVIKQLPNNHLVQDRDGDCSYDRYLHAKILAISGVYAGKRNERIVLNGSGNWSATALKSDEQGMVIDRDSAERKYSAWINEMFRIRLVSAPCDPTLAAEDNRFGRTTGQIDPYREMEG
jgi:phosphatidylserine/phosphatidylglycerophosphate/cardiolipin synthase-like enzyme